MKSAHQIASDIVDAMPLKLGVTSAKKTVLTVMIVEKLIEQRKAGNDRHQQVSQTGEMKWQRKTEQ